ncbi:MAG: efflux RND transporter periplasmic adaptor subunit [Ignavibacteria bacterium]|nr:efflux RND transporter periplasmic adaptor subunit [Ignavibacteria bacterium]
MTSPLFPLRRGAVPSLSDAASCPASMARLLLLPLLLLLAPGCGEKRGDTLTFTGTMDVNTVRVSAQTPGTVTLLGSDEGRQVRAGDTLAVIETDRLGYQLDQNRGSLEELSRQEDAARAQLNASVIARDNLRVRHARLASLLASHAATQQAVDDVKAQLDAADEQIRAARISLSAIESRKKQVDAGAQGIRKQVHDATILSPLAGTVIVRYADRGELVGAGTPVFDIADLSELWTKIYIGETELAFLTLGQAVELRVDGMPGRTFPGTVTWISDKAEFTPKTILTEETRTTLVYPARVIVKNPDGIFKIGMPVTIVAARTNAG